MSAVAIIPARGGSRRIPRKNIRPFHGKPIIAYSIETAKASGLFDLVYVSSDDPAILDISEKCGAKVLLRHPCLSTDDVGTQEVAREVLLHLQTKGRSFDYACCIYATAPLMTADDLRNGFEHLSHYEPKYAYVDGWYYWGGSREFLGGSDLVGGHRILPDTKRWIDINTEDDWQKAEEMYAKLHQVRV